MRTTRQHRRGRGSRLGRSGARLCLERLRLALVEQIVEDDDG